MLRVYYLPVEPTPEGERVLGVDLIHGAILECTEEPDVRKLIMDTTADEHAQLEDMAVLVRDPTQDEIDLFNSGVIPQPPDPELDRIVEILETSPGAITMPEMWELLRLIAHRLGYYQPD